LEVAQKATDPWLRQESLETLMALNPSSNTWRQVAISPEQDQILADLAMHNSNEGNEAARLIGHLRSITATQKLYREAGRERRGLVLPTIQQEAGSLPGSIPLQTRLEIFFDWITRRLSARPLTLLKAYGFSLIGTVLGFGSVAYISYRLPRFLDSIRITVSLERGLFLGILFGSGLFLTRLIMERFPNHNRLAKIVAAILVGGGVLSLAVLSYNVLILNSPVSGILLPLSCLFVATGSAVASLRKNRLYKSCISLATIFTALAGSWWIHSNLAGASINLTPIVAFENTASITQVLALTFTAALPMAILTNLIDLSYGG
jgi:hypothetical protein